MRHIPRYGHLCTPPSYYHVYSLLTQTPYHRTSLHHFLSHHHIHHFENIPPIITKSAPDNSPELSAMICAFNNSICTFYYCTKLWISYPVLILVASQYQLLQYLLEISSWVIQDYYITSWTICWFFS